MKKGLTELVFILDRSGSMSGLETDTIGGFNAMLEKQRKAPGDALVTTVLFDHCSELLHDRIPLAGVANLTERDYFVRGSTALLDALGSAIRKIAHAHIHTAKEFRPGKTVFVIITDGMENSSREYTAEAVRAMIEREKEYGWEFFFLGANIDAIGAASRIGIHADRQRIAGNGGGGGEQQENGAQLRSPEAEQDRTCDKNRRNQQQTGGDAQGQGPAVAADGPHIQTDTQAQKA